jgi:hypothetical protein
MAFVGKLRKSPAMRVLKAAEEAGEGAEAAQDALSELAAALDVATAAGGPQAARCRAMLQLVQLLQLHILGGCPISAVVALLLLLPGARALASFMRASALVTLEPAQPGWAKGLHRLSPPPVAQRSGATQAGPPQ